MGLGMAGDTQRSLSWLKVYLCITLLISQESLCSFYVDSKSWHNSPSSFVFTHAHARIQLTIIFMWLIYRVNQRSLQIHTALFTPPSALWTLWKWFQLMSVPFIRVFSYSDRGPISIGKCSWQHVTMFAQKSVNNTVSILNSCTLKAGN